MHCVRFGQCESVTEVRQQVVVVVVVGVVVNGEGKLSLIFFVNGGDKLYNIYELIIHKFYIKYGLTIRK